MKTSIELRNGLLEVRFPFDQATVQAMRDIDSRRKWNPEAKCWTFPAEELIVRRLADLFGLAEEYLPEDVQALLPKIQWNTKPVDMSAINGHQWRTTPYTHQRRGLAELIQNPWWLSAWDMGSGKSLVIANRLRWGIDHQEFIGPILILCPKSVLTVWPEQLGQHAELSCTVLEGSTVKKKAALRGALDRNENSILVTNYQSLLYLRDTLTDAQFDAVVADECQLLKHGSNATCRAARDVAKSSRFRWALSGTPAPNGLQDFYGIMSFLSPTILGTSSKIAFEQKYCVKKELDAGVRIIVGYKETQDLMKRVRSVSSRVLKKDCLDLPPKMFVERRCVLGDDQLRVYKDLKNKAVANLKTAEREGLLTIRNILCESLRLLQCAGGWLKDDVGQEHPLTPNAKMNLLDEVLDEIGDRQVVVWCEFIVEIKAVAERLRKAGETVTFYGDTSMNERKAALEGFKSGRVKYFVANTQTGGSGINELVVADTMIFYSRGFRWDLYEQAVARLDRSGQTRPMTFVNLVASGTVDERVKEALTKKAGLQELVLGKKVDDIFG